MVSEMLKEIIAQVEEWKKARVFSYFKFLAFRRQGGNFFKKGLKELKSWNPKSQKSKILEFQVLGFWKVKRWGTLPLELLNVDMSMWLDPAPRVTGSDDPESALKYRSFLGCYMSGNLVAPRSRWPLICFMDGSRPLTTKPCSLAWLVTWKEILPLLRLGVSHSSCRSGYPRPKTRNITNIRLHGG